MIHFRRAPPSPALSGVVRGYQQRTGRIDGPGMVVSVPARPDQLLEVYFEAPYLTRTRGEAFAQAPEAVVVGPQLHRRTDLLMTGRIGAFTVSFQPTGFNRLFGIPMPHLLDEAEADADLGVRALTGLSEAIRAAGSFAERVAAAERWLGERLGDARPENSVDLAARRLSASPGDLRIDRLAREAGLSERQFHRRFTHQVGMAPKLYARMARFAALLSDRMGNPGQTWTTLAQAHGYFDQAHLLKDFHAFAGDTPSGFPLEAAAVEKPGLVSDPY
jgi:AraC-like DNA-binding protein